MSSCSRCLRFRGCSIELSPPNLNLFVAFSDCQVAIQFGILAGLVCSCLCHTSGLSSCSLGHSSCLFYFCQSRLTQGLDVTFVVSYITDVEGHNLETHGQHFPGGLCGHEFLELSPISN